MKEDKVEEAKTVEVKLSKREVKIAGIMLIFGLIVGAGVMHFNVQSEPVVCDIRDTIPTNSNTIKVMLINDARCKNCDTSSLEQQLKTALPKIQIEKYDYNSVEGARILAQSQIQFVPAVLLNKEDVEDPALEQLKPYLIEAGTYMSLRIQSDWDPVCDFSSLNCGMQKCKNRPTCRVEMPGSLQVFVMSKCPFGIQAINSMKEVLNNFPKMKVTIGYIASINPSGEIQSLHGITEVNEDIRQVCALDQDINQALDYIWCRNKNINSEEWNACALEAKLDVAKMKNCSEGEEGKNLFTKNIQVAQSLGIGASPTFLVNNRYKFNGITAESIKEGYCEYNPGQGCDNKLTDTAEAEGAC